MKLLFFDLETTGFGYDKCAIIQLGGIVVDCDANGELKPIDGINLKMRPRVGKWIDQRALEINKFTVDEVLSWEDDREAFKKFTKFLEKHVDKFNKMDKFKLVGYNSLHFDIDFLRQWFADNGDKYFGSWFWSDSIDVLSEASRYLTTYRPIMINFKLGNVAKVMGIDVDENALHDGLYDIKTTYKIFKIIMKSSSKLMPFTEEKATEIFNGQEAEKAKNKANITESKFTESNAWLLVQD